MKLFLDITLHCPLTHTAWIHTSTKSESSHKSSFEFEQLTPLQSLQAVVQTTPCLQHTQRLVSQLLLHPHLITFNNLSGAGGKVALTGTHLFDNTCQPHSNCSC